MLPVSTAFPAVKKLLAFPILTVTVCGVYAPALHNGLVWDDTALVMRDPFIRSWRLIPEGFQHFLFADATASNFYRPLQRLSYTIDYAVFGFWTAGTTSPACCTISRRRRHCSCSRGSCSGGLRRGQRCSASCR
ncbi:MAG: hypothetical protein H0V56_13205 [Chthoniobacterales bacterium]|nr:hypothetical protein [Chthoniobacterales bacterium]